MDWRNILTLSVLPLFILFVWHTELYMDERGGVLTNGFMDITSQQMYHILMYVCIGLYSINMIVNFRIEREKRPKVMKNEYRTLG